MNGVRFSRLVVIEEAPPNARGLRQWRCRCDCGQVTVTAQCRLRNGTTTSCGCRRKAMRRTHGMFRDPLYSTWRGMLARCRDSHHRMWHRYGGRGIAVCERWQDFASFHADMSPRPSSKHTMDRVDPDGGYEPGNVRWATRAEQAQTTHHARTVTHDGVTQSLAAWARTKRMSLGVLTARYRAGDRGDALFAPPAGRSELLTVDGRSLTLKEWAAETGIAVNTIRWRIRRGWPASTIITRRVCPDPHIKMG